MKVSKRIIIAGGGTGGHIFPAIAIANALKKMDPGVEILFVGAKGKMEMEKVPAALRPGDPDDVLESDRLQKIQWLGAAMSIAFAAFIAVYWLQEAGRMRGKEDLFKEISVERGAAYFQDGESTVEGAAVLGLNCARCHGENLEGLVGPMLAGEGFVAAWGGRSAAELVEKIQNTMPLQAPGSLSRQQSIDITAYMLQVGNFKPGPSALTDAALMQVTFPASRAAGTPAAAAGAPASD